MVVVLVLTAGMAVFPYVYNYHLSGLSRVAKQVREGQDCAEVRSLMAGYYETHKNSGNELYFNEGSTSSWPVALPGGRVLSLYEIPLIDDVQLIVSCGADGRVARIYFIGD